MQEPIKLYTDVSRKSDTPIGWRDWQDELEQEMIRRGHDGLTDKQRRLGFGLYATGEHVFQAANLLE